MQLHTFTSLENQKKRVLEFFSQAIHKSVEGHLNENCEGEHIFECREVTNSFDIRESWNMKYCQRIYNGPNADCYDVDQF